MVGAHSLTLPANQFGRFDKRLLFFGICAEPDAVWRV
jgi:hypothetical protein